jgi:hypothetical protein
MLALRNNLIVGASTQFEPNRLVTSFSGKTLYSVKSLPGVFFKLFQSKEKREEKTLLAIEGIRQKFWEHVADLLECRTTYIEGYKNKLQGKVYDLNGVEAAEKTILHSTLYFKPIFKAVDKRQELPVVKFLLHQREEDQTVDFVRLCGFMRFVQRKKDFELVTGVETPLVPLQKLYTYNRLRAKEEAKVRAWIEKIGEAKQRPIPGFNGKKVFRLHTNRSIHRYLKAIAEYLLMIEPEKHIMRLGLLECKLLKRGFTVLQEPDPDHIAWRDALHEGVEIRFGSESIVLAEDLPCAPHEVPDQTRVFAVKDDPSKEVVTYQSESELLRRIYSVHKFHYGIRLAKNLSFNNQLQLVIRERLYKPISEFEWSGHSPLTQEDRQLLEPILDLLKKFIALDYTPDPGGRDLRASDFKFTAEGEMRSAISMSFVPKNYRMLEYFVFDCARGNQAVYETLMKESGLHQFEEYRAYVTVVKRALKGREREDAATGYGFYELESLLEDRRRLYDSVIAIRDQVLENVQKEYTVSKKGLSLINKAVLKTYKAHSRGFQLFANFYDQVLNSDIFKTAKEVIIQETEKNRKKLEKEIEKNQKKLAKETEKEKKKSAKDLLKMEKKSPSKRNSSRIEPK